MAAVSSHNRLADIDRAWEDFVRNQKLDRQVIRPVIARSWERCLSYGVDPYANSGSVVLRGLKLQARLDRHRNLIRVATPFMRMLMDTCGEDFIALLCDEEGYVMEILGDPKVLATSEKQLIGKGSNLSEKTMGTNTLGTVLVERAPMQVLAQEHYCRVFHDKTCSAAPIFGPSGSLIGVLDISGHYDKVHPHTLGLVVAAVKAIERQLQLEKVYDELKHAHDELTKAHDFSKTVMESISEGLITVNQKGIITWINAAGGRIMGLEPAEKIGRPLHELGNSLMPIQEVLYNGGFSDRETVLENSRGRYHFTMSAQPIKSENGEIIGAVSTLREFKAVHRLITNMVGAKARFTFDDLIGESETFRGTVSLARKAATSSSTVLLQGESGTGKELFAQAIHNASKRARGPFIAVNCAAIPRELIESELFGYEEGAFTGAKRGGCPGKFELASGGTIFLDEIGDMPLELQVTLLRFLQEKQVTRLGGCKVVPVDVRVIAATHRDLRQEIAKGHFRADLFYRLHIITIKIPPLRERPSDIPELADYFVRKIGWHLGKKLIEISDEAMDGLIGYHWPGNVRELENALERAINVASGNQILPEHLPETLPGLRTNRLAPDTATGLRSLRDIERTAIINTLQNLQGNITQAARVLGVTRATLYNKIEQYGIKFNSTVQYLDTV